MPKNDSAENDVNCSTMATPMSVEPLTSRETVRQVRRDGAASPTQRRREHLVRSHVRSATPAIKARFATHEVSRERFICIDFAGPLGEAETLVLPAIETTRLPKLATTLVARGAPVPADRKARESFVSDLVANAGPDLCLTDRPGFRGLAGFVLPEAMRGACARTHRWALPHSPEVGDAGRRTGAFYGWRNGVGKIALASTYLSLGILLALAAPLPSYVREHSKKRGDGRLLMPEGALFNISGISSSGKTTVARVAASVLGHPGAMVPWEFSRPGLELVLSRHNDILTIIDDTETCVGDEPHALMRALRQVTQLLASGRSKNLAQIPGSRPPLTWSTLCLSTSPEPLRAIASNHGWSMSAGELVRAFNIPVPPREEGGIFDQLDCAEADRVTEAARLARELEECLAGNFGRLMLRWLDHLGGHSKSQNLLKRQDCFVESVCSRGDPWERRFAQKFGALAAAGELAVEAGLLPWPKNWPAEVARTAFHRAMASALAPADKVRSFVTTLAIRHEDARLFPKATKSADTVLGPEALGARLSYGGEDVLALREEAVAKGLGGQAGRIEFDSFVARHSLIRGGHGGKRTTQIRQPMIIDGKRIEKPRLLLIAIAGLQPALEALSNPTL